VSAGSIVDMRNDRPALSRALSGKREASPRGHPMLHAEPGVDHSGRVSLTRSDGTLNLAPLEN
jgi:hypothetical protein